jgi:UDP-N-acetyl-D-mannosaminuronate dehydrogenase
MNMYRNDAHADLLVVGLGYVGLPLAREAAFAGLTVVGYDLKAEVAAGLNAGRSHVGDVPAADVAEMLRKGFRATCAEEEIGEPGTVVICVPTPLSADSAPDLSAVRGAAGVAGRLLRSGMLVVLESTTYPGTTDEVVRPLLEKASGLTAGVDFALAFSPERIDPGNPHYSIRNTPKVVGGQTASCIPIDPNYLSYKVRTLGYPFRFAELAQEINTKMPAYVVDRAAEVLNARGKPLNGARVLLLGVTYKPDVADQRESPVAAAARKLAARGAVLAYHDPYVDHWQPAGQPVRRAADLDAELPHADLVILMQDHSGYDLDRITRHAPLILDTRGRLHGPHIETL